MPSRIVLRSLIIANCAIVFVEIPSCSLSRFCVKEYNVLMSRIRVGVVRGGPSSEYVVSLKTGENVLRHLDREKYAPVDILITPRGDWFMNGIRSDIATIAHHIDIAWNALHGAFGEDGKVQQHFESFCVPYTGSGVVASAVGMHKGLAKDCFEKAGILVPFGFVVDRDDVHHEVAAQIILDHAFPLIVKPVNGGSSVATRVVHSPEKLFHAIIEASDHGDVLIEEFIAGKEATVCVVESGEEGEHLPLFPIEIVPPSANDFFDFDAKYGGESEEVCPGRFPLSTHAELRDLSVRAHRAIGARHYSRSDFIISEKGIYILEINTLPGLTKESLLPKALAKAGVSMPEFLDHVIGLTLRGR
jgi:D-alanine-D-alanine ligase